MTTSITSATPLVPIGAAPIAATIAAQPSSKVVGSEPPSAGAASTAPSTSAIPFQDPGSPDGVQSAKSGASLLSKATSTIQFAYSAWKNKERVATGGAEATAAGAAAGELIDRAKISTGGRLFLQNRSEGLPTEPVRTYMPFELDGMSLQQRASLTVDSMVSQGAFERSKIVIASPTGTGGINPGPVIMDEILSKGDTAWVVAQYGDKPSVQSLHKTPAAVKAFMELTRQVADKRNELYPNGDGPELYASATSLGARNIHEALVQHGDELLGPKINLKHVLLLGAPESLTKFTPETLPSGVVGRFRSPEEVAAVTPEAAEKMKVVEYAHWDDPVRLMDFKTAFKRPSWLTEAGAVPGVAHDRPFIPIGTLAKLGYDVQKAIANGTDDSVDNVGHDYRGDMGEAVALGLGHRNASADALQGASLIAQDRAIADVQRIKRVLAGTE